MRKGKRVRVLRVLCLFINGCMEELLPRKNFFVFEPQFDLPSGTFRTVRTVNHIPKIKTIKNWNLFDSERPNDSIRQKRRIEREVSFFRMYNPIGVLSKKEYRPRSMPKSPLTVPGAELAGLVAPII
jgi:PBP1b-binding outer membrane lipoprotein LpoB